MNDKGRRQMDEPKIAETEVTYVQENYTSSDSNNGYNRLMSTRTINGI